MIIRDIFGLVVRLAGLMMVVFGIFDGLHAAMSLLGLPLSSHYGALTDVIAALIWFLLGAVFIVGARTITRLAYRGE